MAEIEQLSIGRESKFFSIGEALAKEQEARNSVGKMKFGVKYLDECLGGIVKNDLVIIGAKSGIGKTQLAKIIAEKNSGPDGGTVHYFALEAEPFEIERRLKYQISYEVFQKTMRAKHPFVNMNFMDWMDGKFNEIFAPYEAEINAIVAERNPGLKTFYRVNGERFTSQTLKDAVLAIQHDTDLIIIDHLHFFDIEDQNENRGMKELMMTIRDLAMLVAKPMVVIAHMRKTNGGPKQKNILPDIDDFMGSSDIAKMCTKAIIIGPYDMASPQNNWWTAMRAAKNRRDSSRTRWIGVVNYNTVRDAYDARYFIGRNAYDKLDLIEKMSEFPYWAVGAEMAREEISPPR